MFSGVFVLVNRSASGKRNVCQLDCANNKERPAFTVSFYPIKVPKATFLHLRS